MIIKVMKIMTRYQTVPQKCQKKTCNRGRWEGGLGWGIHVNPWLIHVNVWQKPLQYCKVISLQLIKINGKNNKKKLINKLKYLGSPLNKKKKRKKTCNTKVFMKTLATVINYFWECNWYHDFERNSGNINHNS